ncbi:hypothetical protein [Actinoplanes hulinensis]|uniref:hypothetical protein n=1 Tax=Actinoplanes hulinensis TaxID=1144547 RepID=UPI001FE84978|nr:hypothetical protein [Actinoplanes hulinensis]
MTRRIGSCAANCATSARHSEASLDTPSRPRWTNPVTRTKAIWLYKGDGNGSFEFGEQKEIWAGWGVFDLIV